MAVMAMLALVVLGLFSYQRLKVDQFPDVDVSGRRRTDRVPGRLARRSSRARSPRKVEEAVNIDRRHQRAELALLRGQLGRHHPVQPRHRRPPRRRRRAREAQRGAADAARRGQGTARAALRSGVAPDLHAGAELARRQPRPAAADHLRRPGGQEAARERARRRLGHAGRARCRREVNIYLRPAAMEAFGVTVDQVVGALRTENRRAAGRHDAHARRPSAWCRSRARVERPEELSVIDGRAPRQPAGPAVAGGRRGRRAAGDRQPHASTTASARWRSTY